MALMMNVTCGRVHVTCHVYLFASLHCVSTIGYSDGMVKCCAIAHSGIFINYDITDINGTTRATCTIGSETEGGFI